MGVNPCYYRQPEEFYPHDAIILTHAGTFPLELEHYLGKAGADSAYISKENGILKDIYAPFVRYDNGKEYVDYTKPSRDAYYKTYEKPVSIGKKTLKIGKNYNPIAPFISVIAGMIIFASLYILVRDCKIISNSTKLIQSSEYIQKFLEEAKNENPPVIYDPVYKSLEKVAQLREKIYVRNRFSAVVGLAMTITIIAASVIAIGAAIVGSHVVLIGTSAIVGTLFLSHCIKTIVEWKGRLDKRDSKEILNHTEALRCTHPPHLEPDFLTAKELERENEFLPYRNPKILYG